jgi:hypothetical protein
VNLKRSALTATLVVAVLAGLVQPASAAPVTRSAVTSAAASTPAAADPPPTDPGPHTSWDGVTGLPDEGIDPRLRQIVVDNAELADDQEVRDAATAALTGGDDAVMAFLTTGLDAAKAKATARKAETARQNLAAIQPMKGTGSARIISEHTTGGALLTTPRTPVWTLAACPAAASPCRSGKSGPRPNCSRSSTTWPRAELTLPRRRIPAR